MTSPLVVSNVVKQFGDVVAVNDVSIELQPGELLALVGPSGCGKSTLLRSVAGLLDIDAGAIELDGTLVDDGVRHLPPERRGAGLVFQEHALFPHMSVRDNVGFGLRGRSGSEAAARVAEMLDLVSLADFGDRYPHELSGGERQRVALARALAPGPGLMLFDEPFASLDHNLRVQLRLDVGRALRSTGTAAVFVTHDQTEALAIGDRIAVMRAGHLVQVGSPETVFHQPTDRFVGEFMGDASFLPVATSTGQISSALGPLRVDAGVDINSIVAMVRPDDVTFRASATGSATIVDRQYGGSGWLATARLGDGTDVLVATSHLDPPEIGSQGDLELLKGHEQVPVPLRHQS